MWLYQKSTFAPIRTIAEKASGENKKSPEVRVSFFARLFGGCPKEGDKRLFAEAETLSLYILD